MNAALFWIFFVGGAISIVVYWVAFRYALHTHFQPRSMPHRLPKAEVVRSSSHGASDRAKAVGKGQALGAVRLVQAGLVAFGITAIVIMVLSLVGSVFIWLIYG